MFSSSLWFTDICANDCACVCAKLLQSHVTLCDPMDCRPPGSSVHGALQARILEWVAMPSSSGSSQPRVRTCISYVSCIGRWVLCHLYHLGSPWVQLKMQGSSWRQRQNPFGKGIILRAEFIEEDESAQDFEPWWVYAGKPPDDILGKRSWVIEWWRQEHWACSNRYLDCTNLCESPGFWCRGSTTPLESKYLSLDTWRQSEGQFDFTHITSHPSITAQRVVASHLWFLPQGKGRAWEWMASLRRWAGCCLRCPCLSHPMQSLSQGWVGRVWESSKWDSQRTLKGLGCCYSVSDSNRKPWDASGMCCPWIFLNWSTYTPNTTWAWPTPDPVASSLCVLLMVTESMSSDRWLLSTCRKPAGQGEATDFSFTSTLEGTNGRILGEHRSLAILLKESVNCVVHGKMLSVTQH